MLNPALDPAHQQLLDRLARQTHHAAILAAFAAVPRHWFLPHVPLEQAYADVPIPLKQDGRGVLVSSASQPTMMALMLEQLDLRAGHNVLEVGTASGFNAALMQTLVGNRGTVTSIEIDAELARQAEQNLLRAGYGQVRVVIGDGAQGYAPRAAYDRLIVTAGVYDVPQMWMRQLKPDGVMVMPIWLNGVQVSARFQALPDGSFYSADNRPCSFVYLRGIDAPPRFRRKIGTQGMVLLSQDIEQIDSAMLNTLFMSNSEMNYLEGALSAVELGKGLQLFPMLNPPEGMSFALFHIPQEAQAYGMTGDGLALVGRGSAAFVPYEGGGAVYTFGASEAFLALHEVLDQWIAAGKPSAEHLRLRLVPHDSPMPSDIPAHATLYPRQHAQLAAWVDLT